MEPAVAQPLPTATIVSRRWWRVLLRVLLLGLLSAAAVLVALELGFRAVPQTIPLGACKSSLTLAHAYCEYYYQYDQPPRLGYVYRPGYGYDGLWNPADPAVVDASEETCASFPDHTFHYRFKADEHGFVNHTPTWEDEYDIVITGDSFTMPFAPVWWVDVLSEQTGMSVLNLGMSGWGTLSEVEAVRRYGLDKRPRWVILLYFEGNDLFNVAEYQRRRESGLDWRTYQLQLVSPVKRLIMPHVLSYWWSEIEQEITAKRPPATCRYPMTVSTNVRHFPTVFFYPHIAALSAQRDSILRSEEWALATQAILDLRAETLAQGGRFLLVYVPAKERLYWRRLWNERDIGHFLELTTPLRSYQELDAHIDDQMRLVEEFAAANQIEFINLSGELWRRTMEDGIELYNYADVHWNEAGNRLVGQLLADYIKAAESPQR